MLIKTQKKIMFIPFVNFISFFIWLKLMKKKNANPSFFLKKWIRILVYFLIIIIPSTLIVENINNTILANIIEAITVYCIFLVISYQSIKAQEELGAA